MRHAAYKHGMSTAKTTAPHASLFARPAGAVPLAERLRELVALAPLTHGAESFALSISIGLAQWAGAQEAPARLLVRADAALYEAKQHGRDRVASARIDAQWV